jgi:hypothetical protein
MIRFKKLDRNMTHDEMIYVLQAHKEGERIQRQNKNSELGELEEEWIDILTPTWDFRNYNFRVRRKPRKWWLNVYRDGYRENCVRYLSKKEAVEAVKDREDFVDCIPVQELL